jgi:hypothetical protein
MCRRCFENQESGEFLRRGDYLSRILNFGDKAKPLLNFVDKTKLLLDSAMIYRFLAMNLDADLTCQYFGLTTMRGMNNL